MTPCSADPDMGLNHAIWDTINGVAKAPVTAKVTAKSGKSILFFILGTAFVNQKAIEKL